MFVGSNYKSVGAEREESVGRLGKLEGTQREHLEVKLGAP